jgi:hypothetical protein
MRVREFERVNVRVQLVSELDPQPYDSYIYTVICSVVANQDLHTSSFVCQF